MSSYGQVSWREPGSDHTYRMKSSSKDVFLRHIDELKACFAAKKPTITHMTAELFTEDSAVQDDEAEG